MVVFVHAQKYNEETSSSLQIAGTFLTGVQSMGLLTNISYTTFTRVLFHKVCDNGEMLYSIAPLYEILNTL